MYLVMYNQDVINQLSGEICRISQII